jgi:hypothetical protein
VFSDVLGVSVYGNNRCNLNGCFVMFEVADSLFLIVRCQTYYDVLDPSCDSLHVVASILNVAVFSPFYNDGN